jgi:hypothetical protein
MAILNLVAEDGVELVDFPPSAIKLATDRLGNPSTA